MTARAALAALALLLALTVGARAEQLVTAISRDAVAITSNFNGETVVVFGTIERDAQTISRSAQYEVAVVLSGPLGTVVTRRKERTAGLWINRASERLRQVPSFLAVLSTRPLTEIASDTQRARLGLGLDMLPINRQTSPEPPVRTDFEAAYMRLMQANGLYRQSDNGVEFLSAQLFRAPIALPANVPIGTYSATVYLFRDGAMLSTTTEELTIGKAGFEEAITTFAHTNGWLYGLATVLMACATGWLAGLIFRKD